MTRGTEMLMSVIGGVLLAKEYTVGSLGTREVEVSPIIAMGFQITVHKSSSQANKTII